MKIATLNSLKEFLNLMKIEFGTKELSDKHRNALDTYILNLDYSSLEFDTGLIVSGGVSSATLGIGQLGVMILGTS